MIYQHTDADRDRALTELLDNLRPGNPSKLIWQSMLELCGVKSGELIPATHFLPLSYWLQARQTLSAQSAPTLTSLQGALKQPLEAAEWQKIVDFASRSWQVTPQTTLSPAQILALLNKVFVLPGVAGASNVAGAGS